MPFLEDGAGNDTETKSSAIVFLARSTATLDLHHHGAAGGSQIDPISFRIYSSSTELITLFITLTPL